MYLIFSSFRKDMVSLIHLLNVGGFCSFHKSNIRRLASREVKAMTTWALPLRGRVSTVKPKMAHNGFGGMTTPKIVE